MTEQLNLLATDLPLPPFRISHASPELQARVRAHVAKVMARHGNQQQVSGFWPESPDQARHRRAKAIIDATGQALALEFGAEPESWTW